MLGLLALAIPAIASASTQWFYERQVIAPGETVEVESSNPKKPLIVALKEPGRIATKIYCDVSGKEAFWNEPENGIDETRSISFSCEPGPCGEVTITPILPWHSTLLESEPPLMDLWEDVSLDLTCGRKDYGVFTGSMIAKVGDVDPATASETTDDLDNVITFRGDIKRPLLNGPNGDKVWFNGYYRLGGKNRGISD